MRNINIYGSTGIIGQKSLKLINSNFSDIKINLLLAHSNYKQLIKHRPEALNPLLRVVTDRMRNLTDFLEDLGRNNG